MITEDYVSFETAKLLKEKGFNEECSRFYMPNGHGRWKYEHYHDFDISNRIECPTLQMAMKWLREAHNIYIQIWILEDNGYWFNIEKILNIRFKRKFLYSTGLEDIYFDTYEEACESAIKYCLENLLYI